MSLSNHSQSLAIKFQQPTQTHKVLMALWLFIGLLTAVTLWLVKPNISIFWQVALVLGFILGVYWNWSVFKKQFEQYQAVYWNQQFWFLLIDGEKTAIDITANTRVLPYWILLEFKISEQKGFKRNLWLPKDCMQDKDYRDLCRCLRFIDNDPTDGVD